jgi:hypothetical protein
LLLALSLVALLVLSFNCITHGQYIGAGPSAPMMEI